MEQRHHFLFHWRWTMEEHRSMYINMLPRWMGGRTLIELLLRINRVDGGILFYLPRNSYTLTLYSAADKRGCTREESNILVMHKCWIEIRFCGFVVVVDLDGGKVSALKHVLVPGWLLMTMDQKYSLYRSRRSEMVIGCSIGKLVAPGLYYKLLLRYKL